MIGLSSIKLTTSQRGNKYFQMLQELQLVLHQENQIYHIILQVKCQQLTDHILMAGEKNFNIKNGLSLGGVEVIDSNGDIVAP